MGNNIDVIPPGCAKNGRQRCQDKRTTNWSDSKLRVAVRCAVSFEVLRTCRCSFVLRWRLFVCVSVPDNRFKGRTIQLSAKVNRTYFIIYSPYKFPQYYFKKFFFTINYLIQKYCKPKVLRFGLKSIKKK